MSDISSLDSFDCINPSSDEEFFDDDDSVTVSQAKYNEFCYVLIDVADGKKALENDHKIDSKTSQYLQSITKNLRIKRDKISVQIESQLKIRGKNAATNISKKLEILKKKATTNSCNLFTLSLMFIISAYLLYYRVGLNPIVLIYLAVPIISMLFAALFCLMDLYRLNHIDENVISNSFYHNFNIFKRS